MGKHLLLVGGGHAHLCVLRRAGEFVLRGYRVTLVSKAPYHYYSGMGPGLLSGIYEPRQARFHVRKMVADGGGTFVKGTVRRVLPEEQAALLADGRRIDYDVVSFNVGSRIPQERLAVQEGAAVFPVKPIERLLMARRRALELEQPRAVVVGAGPAGVEVCGNLRRLFFSFGREAVVALASSGAPLAGWPQRARRLVTQSLERRGVHLHRGARVERIGRDEAVLADGTRLPCDISLLALGTRPPELFVRSGLLTGPQGGLLVNSFLQSTERPEVFGGGDCIKIRHIDLPRVGVYAVRQGELLCRNLMAALEGRELAEFDPGGDYALILNLGNGRGIVSRGGLALDGRVAMKLKDRIDRRFMSRFQVSGELAERSL